MTDAEPRVSKSPGGWTDEYRRRLAQRLGLMPKTNETDEQRGENDE